MDMNFKKAYLTFAFIVGVLGLTTEKIHAVVYLTTDEARHLIWGDEAMTRVDITLTKSQAKAIRKASTVRVRSLSLKAWKTPSGGWFILDHVIGKHEHIDIAVGISADGQLRGIEVLEYRETYGSEVKEPSWLAQFFGKTHHKVLKLDEDIQNISGATLSSRHITDGANRLLHTWNLVLRHL